MLDRPLPVQRSSSLRPSRKIGRAVWSPPNLQRSGGPTCPPGEASNMVSTPRDAPNLYSCREIRKEICGWRLDSERWCRVLRSRTIDRGQREGWSGPRHFYGRRCNHGRKCRTVKFSKWWGNLPVIMEGYYKQPQQAAAVEWFDASGERFIRTGGYRPLRGGWVPGPDGSKEGQVRSSRPDHSARR